MSPEGREGLPWPILTDADLERDLDRTLKLVMAGVKDALLAHAGGAA